MLPQALAAPAPLAASGVALEVLVNCSALNLLETPVPMDGWCGATLLYALRIVKLMHVRFRMRWTGPGRGPACQAMLRETDRHFWKSLPETHRHFPTTVAAPVW